MAKKGYFSGCFSGNEKTRNVLKIVLIITGVGGLSYGGYKLYKYIKTKKKSSEEKTESATYNYSSSKSTTSQQSGLSTEQTKKLQTNLKITADGIYGSGTKAAVKELQKKYNLKQDGIYNKELDKKTQWGILVLTDKEYNELYFKKK